MDLSGWGNAAITQVRVLKLLTEVYISSQVAINSVRKEQKPGIKERKMSSYLISPSWEKTILLTFLPSLICYHCTRHVEKTLLLTLSPLLHLKILCNNKSIFADTLIHYCNIKYPYEKVCLSLLYD